MWTSPLTSVSSALRNNSSKRLAPFAIDTLLKKRAILIIDVFERHLITEIVFFFFKFSLKTDFYGDIRRNDSTIT